MLRTAFIATIALSLAATPRATAQTFTDVPIDHWAYSYIETLVANGITAGCGGNEYCPAAPVTRAQMAAFLERGMNGSGYVPPPASGTVFLDVNANDFAASFIEQLAADGITAGCGGGNYCPDSAVTRDQMAVFLLRAKYGPNYSPPAATGAFADVEVADWAAAWIEQLAAEGVTVGCGGENFCPGDTVSRDQMAVFLVRTFDLSLPGEGTMTLGGIAGGVTLANAKIQAAVFPATSNGSSSTVFTTTADVQGRFSLDITSDSADNFVLLTAEGVSAQEGVKLISYLGSTGFVASQATGGFSEITVSDYGALEISHVSTAMAVLAERAHGGPILDAADLADAESKVAGAELLDMAAALKTLIDNASVVLPSGLQDSLALVRDPFAYSVFLSDLESNFAPEFDSSILGVADSLAQSYVLSTLPGDLYFVIRKHDPLALSSFVLQLNVDSSGKVVLMNGASDATWWVDQEGMLIVDLTDPPQTEFWTMDPDADTPTGQVRGVNYVDRLTIQRLGDGIAVDQVLALQRMVTTYPDNPELLETVNEGHADRNALFMSFRSGKARPFVADEIAGATLATGYYHQGNSTSAQYDRQFGVELLTFNTDGSGISERTVRTFMWTIDEDGALVIRFANGDQSKIARYSRHDIADHTVVVGALADGTSKSSGGEFLISDGPSVFSEDMLLNRRYRSFGAVVSDTMEAFDFLYLPAGEGCQIQVIDGQRSIAELEWWLTAASMMDSWRFHAFEPSVPFQRRAWQLIAIETGQFGDRYWVIENMEINDQFDPGYSWSDPSITTGRINAYEFIQDLSGVANPCAP